MVIDARIHYSLRINNYNIRSFVYHTVSVPFGLKSTAASVRVSLTVTNRRNERVTMYWVNYSGGTRSYGTIEPDHTWGVNTFATHPWLIVDSNNDIIGIYIPYTSASISVY